MMKKISTLFLTIASCFFFVAVQAQDFITKWTFTSAAGSISFRATTAGGAVSYTWSASPSGASGTGSFTSTAGGMVNLPMTIAAGDVVTLSITPANFRALNMLGSSSIAGNLTDVTQWGIVPWATMNGAFGYCSNLNITATDVPNLSAVTSMSSMFYGCSSLTGPANINTWNTANVTDMYFMFAGAGLFNQPMGAWNTANVTNMTGMFDGAGSFNQPIGAWNTANVTNMGAMFLGATSFNQPIDTWNTANVFGMYYMFTGAASFNQPIGAWNTANVTNMTGMFDGAGLFNQNIGSWTLNSLVDMTDMLNNCGMDYCTYSNTLKGWATNNPAVTGSTLGANGLYYAAAVGSAERNTLVTTRGWTIIGDAQVSFTPYLMPYGSTITGIASCGEQSQFLTAANTTSKILGIHANGNSSFNFSTATVTVTNKTLNGTLITSPGTAIYSSPSAGYYQNTDGINTMRVLRRMHTVQQAGTYSTNGGVVVRVYYDPAEITTMVTNAVPATSNPITTSGWFKSSKHSALDVVNDLTSTTLNNAYGINPIATGTENGVNYAEFLLSSFSTIGYYAYTMPYVLPVTLISFNAASENCKVKLNWKTAEETSFSHFEIERSNDGVSYTTIGTVNASGNNSNYSYTDNTPKEGKNIYRLKMMDADGKYKYSSLKLVTFSCNGAKSIMIYPNPTSDNINISISGYTKQVTGKLFNAVGQLHKTAVLVNGTNSIPSNGLANGVYNLVITDEAGKDISHKIIVQH